MVATVWQDTKPVVMLSSQHDPNTTTTVRRKKGDGSVLHVTCPQVIVDYNAHMGGVDLGDQYRKYQVRMKSHKFYKYIFWFLFEICILNSYMLYQYYYPCIRKNLSYLDYRVQLAQQLIGNYCSRKRPGRPPSSHIPPPKRITLPHFPAKTTKGRCAYCKDGCTVWHCGQCDKHLCHTGHHDTDCYLKHHIGHGLMYFFKLVTSLPLSTCSTVLAMYLLSLFTLCNIIINIYMWYCNSCNLCTVIYTNKLFKTDKRD